MPFQIFPREIALLDFKVGWKEWNSSSRLNDKSTFPSEFSLGRFWFLLQFIVEVQNLSKLECGVVCVWLRSQFILLPLVSSYVQHRISESVHTPILARYAPVADFREYRPHSNFSIRCETEYVLRNVLVHQEVPRCVFRVAFIWSTHHQYLGVLLGLFVSRITRRTPSALRLQVQQLRLRQRYRSTSHNLDGVLGTATPSSR
mmetsp:Transcript_16471/g.23090  ORF Transcript_16471/g.23090 Transcript_16471/m.23090 type:complete len:202 (-) Transcript_16471:359-964(-)